MPVARISPARYVSNLRSLIIPGYTGFPGGQVEVSRYVSANTLFGGANRASQLQAALYALADSSEKQTLALPGIARVFTGQGMPEGFTIVLLMVNQYRAALAKNPIFAPYFTQTDYLQALLDAGFLGLDCIGFVGGYMVEAGIELSYGGRVPLGFATAFPLVKSLAQVGPLSVVMFSNGMHVQIIHKVTQIEDHKITIHLCQSSSLKDSPASQGPQTNTNVTITDGGGTYLPVQPFRDARSSKSKWAEYAADAAAKGKTPNDNDYEMYLRDVMSIKGYTGLGYMDGAIFTLSGGGEPANPSGGSVYIGTMPDLTLAAYG